MKRMIRATSYSGVGYNKAISMLDEPVTQLYVSVRPFYAYVSTPDIQEDGVPVRKNAIDKVVDYFIEQGAEAVRDKYNEYGKIYQIRSNV